MERINFKMKQPCSQKRETGDMNRDDVLFVELLQSAKEFVSAQADSFSTRSNAWEDLSSISLPSAWHTQRSWALRTSFAATSAMMFALQASSREGGIWSWCSGEVLAPVVAIACTHITLGNTILISYGAGKGCLIGSMFAIIVLELTFFLIPRKYESLNLVRDILCLFLFSMGCLFLTTRQCSLTEKKLACALFVLGVCLPVINGLNTYNAPWYEPMKLLITCYIGTFLCILALLIPIPSLAINKLSQRLKYQAELTRILSEEQLLSVLRADASTYCYAEVLLNVATENHAYIKTLLLGSEFELQLFGYGSKVFTGLEDMVKLLGDHLNKLQGKQLTLRGRNLTGKLKLSDCQVLWLRCSVTEMMTLNKRLNLLIKTSVDRLVIIPHLSNRFIFFSWLHHHRNKKNKINSEMIFDRNRGVDPIHIDDDEDDDDDDEYFNLIHDTESALSSFITCVNEARADMFYGQGKIRVSFRKFLQNSLQLQVNKINTAQDKPSSSSSSPSSSSSSSSSFRSSLPTMINKFGEENPSLYGMEKSVFMQEHCRRLSHIYFTISMAQQVIKHIKSKQASGYSSLHPEEKDKQHEKRDNDEKEIEDNEEDKEDECDLEVVNSETSSVEKNLRTRNLLGWMVLDKLRKYISPFVTPDNRLSEFSVKQAAALSLASLLCFIPPLRARAPQAYWAAVTIAFILVDDGKGVGASVSVGEVRLLGTTLGSIYGLICVTFVYGTSQRDNISLALLLGVWVFATALFRGHPTKGYAAVVAGFTAAIIMHGGNLLLQVERDSRRRIDDDDDDRILDRNSLALYRIVMNVLGVAIFIAVEIFLRPRSARVLVKQLQVEILSDLNNSMRTVMLPFLDLVALSSPPSSPLPILSSSSLSPLSSSSSSSSSSPPLPLSSTNLPSVPSLNCCPQLDEPPPSSLSSENNCPPKKEYCKSIPEVPTMDILLNNIYTRLTHRIRESSSFSHVPAYYVRELQFATRVIIDEIDVILDTFFSAIHEIHPFYSNILNFYHNKAKTLLVYEELMKTKVIIHRLSHHYSNVIETADTLLQCKQLRKEGIATMLTLLFQKIKDHYFNHCNIIRQTLCQLFTIDINQTIVLIGQSSSSSSCSSIVQQKKSFINKYCFNMKSFCSEISKTIQYKIGNIKLSDGIEHLQVFEMNECMNNDGIKEFVQKEKDDNEVDNEDDNLEKEEEKDDDYDEKEDDDNDKDGPIKKTSISEMELVFKIFLQYFPCVIILYFVDQKEEEQETKKSELQPTFENLKLLSKLNLDRNLIVAMNKNKNQLINNNLFENILTYDANDSHEANDNFLLLINEKLRRIYLCLLEKKKTNSPQNRIRTLTSQEENSSNETKETSLNAPTNASDNNQLIDVLMDMDVTILTRLTAIEESAILDPTKPLNQHRSSGSDVNDQKSMKKGIEYIDEEGIKLTSNNVSSLISSCNEKQLNDVISNVTSEQEASKEIVAFNDKNKKKSFCESKLSDDYISNGLISTMKAFELTHAADGEPKLWNNVFPKNDFLKVIEAENKIFKLLSFLKDSVEDAADIEALPLMVPSAMVSFSKHVSIASKETSLAWQKTHRLIDVKNDRLHIGNELEMNQIRKDMNNNNEEDLFASASLVATPFLALEHSTAQSLLDQRNGLIDRAFYSTQIPPLKATLGWMATSLLCHEIAVTLSELGGGMRDVIAKQSTVS